MTPIRSLPSIAAAILSNALRHRAGSNSSPSRTSGVVKPFVGVDVVVAEAALVTGPEVVHLLVRQGLAANEVVAADLVRHRASDRAVATYARSRFQVPRPRDESVRLRRQSADGADLDRVAGEVTVEGLVVEREDLCAGTTVDELDELIPGDLVGEPHAAPAQARTARGRAPRGPRSRAPSRSDASLRCTGIDPGPCAYVWSCRGHSPARSQIGQSSGWLISRNSSMPSCASTAYVSIVSTIMPSATGVAHAGQQLVLALDLHETHPAHRDRLHAGVVAEARDEDAELFGDIDQQATGLGLNGRHR